MPQILELKTIDGQVWARLDIDLEKTPQPVSLLTSPEVDCIKVLAARDERERCATVAEEYMNRCDLDGASSVAKAILEA